MLNVNVVAVLSPRQLRSLHLLQLQI